MANDISTSIVANAINNGSIIVGQPGKPYKQVMDDQDPALHTPAITTIQDKYDSKYDDYEYYL